MSFFHRPRRDIAPASATFDIRECVGAVDKPMWISFAYWVATPALLAGNFSMNVTYDDARGVSRVIDGGGAVNLTLGGLLGGGFFYLPPQLIIPDTDSSDILLKTVLTGAALTSKISCDILITGFAPNTLSVWND